MQKLSIIRFKPKPDCLDEFAANLTAFNDTRSRVFHLMRSGDELHAVVIREASILEQDAADGVKWFQVPYAYQLKTRWDHKTAPGTPFGPQPKDHLTTGFRAYGYRLKREPCMFPTTVALSDITNRQKS